MGVFRVLDDQLARSGLLDVCEARDVAGASVIATVVNLHPIKARRQHKLGVGSVISAWDIAVAKMRQGETAVVHCTSEYGYGWEGSPPKIPKDAALRFEIELLGWKEKDKEDMSSAERLAHAQEVRAEGAELFKAAEWEAARFKFAEGAEYLDGAPRGERISWRSVSFA